MNFFIENFWIWLLIAAFFGFAGYASYTGTRNRKALIILEALAVLVFIAGFLVTTFIDTDYKSISRMLTKLAKAIEEDDVAKVKSFIQPSATSTIVAAEGNMRLVKISSAKFSNLEIEVNHHTSPPTATISFHATVKFRWKNAAPSMFREYGSGEFEDFARVRFTAVELEKTKDSWLVGDRCEFTPSAL